MSGIPTGLMIWIKLEADIYRLWKSMVGVEYVQFWSGDVEDGITSECLLISLFSSSLVGISVWHAWCQLRCLPLLDRIHVDVEHSTWLP
jgi:hypothetical protein